MTATTFLFHQSAWETLRRHPPVEGEKWNETAYNLLADKLYTLRVGNLFNSSYLCFNGWCEGLAFEERQLPDQFDIKQQVYVTPDSSWADSTCITWQFAEDCFISVLESGDYFGMLNVWWRDAFGSLEAAKDKLEDIMRDKLSAHFHY
jgi:hypothetical protein